MEAIPPEAIPPEVIPPQEVPVQPINNVDNVATPFALTPALANNQVLDYNQPSAIKLYHKATAKLDKEYDCTSSGLKTFLDQINDRALAYGWTHILDIPEDIDSPLEDLTNLMTGYGQVTLKQVQEHAATYIGTHTRAAQDSLQLYYCIMASLTKEAQDKVRLSSKDYTINGFFSGPCALKVIIREAHIDTKATTNHIRTSLNNLDKYIVTIDSDIEKFNHYVKVQLDALAARGETTHDLLCNLFSAYKAASNQAFVEYIGKKQDQYEEGEELEATHLMRLALNKYKTLHDRNEWNNPSKAEEKIIALQAQLKLLQQAKKPTNKKGDGQIKKKTDPGANKNPKSKEKPKWMLIPPKDGEKHHKKVDGKDYHWCPKHKACGRHEPKDCQGVGVKVNNNKPNTKKEGKDAQEEKKIQLGQALHAIMNQDE